MFFLDIGRDYLRSYPHKDYEANPAEMNQLYEDMIEEAVKDFEAFNVRGKDLTIERSADVRYQGQYHELEIKFPANDVTQKAIKQVVEEFHQLHKELFTFSLPWVPVEIINLRMTAKVKSQKIPITKIAAGTKDPSGALIRKRQCYFDGKFVESPIYDGLKLEAGNTILGNAIIEEATTTTVIPAGNVCMVDDYGNYIVVRKVQ
jgi:N-methylhydantoinase A